MTYNQNVLELESMLQNFMSKQNIQPEYIDQSSQASAQIDNRYSKLQELIKNLSFDQVDANLNENVVGEEDREIIEQLYIKKQEYVCKIKQEYQQQINEIKEQALNEPTPRFNKNSRSNTAQELIEAKFDKTDSAFEKQQFVVANLQTQIDELQMENNQYKMQLNKYHQIRQEIDSSVISMEKYIEDSVSQNDHMMIVDQETASNKLNSLQQVLSQTHFNKIKNILNGLNQLEQKNINFELEKEVESQEELSFQHLRVKRADFEKSRQMKRISQEHKLKLMMSQMMMNTQEMSNLNSIQDISLSQTQNNYTEKSQSIIQNQDWNASQDIELQTYNENESTQQQIQIGIGRMSPINQHNQTNKSLFTVDHFQSVNQCIHGPQNEPIKIADDQNGTANQSDNSRDVDKSNRSLFNFRRQTNQMEHLQNQIKEMEQVMSQQQQNIEVLNQEVEAVQNMNECLQENLDAQMQQNQMLMEEQSNNSSSQAWQQAIGALVEKIGGKNLATIEQIKELVDNRDQEQGISSEIEEARVQIENERETNQILESQLKQLKLDLEQKESDVASQEQKLKEDGKKLKQWMQELGRQKKQLKVEEENLTKRKKDYQSADELLTKEKEEFNHLKESFNQYQSQLQQRSELMRQNQESEIQMQQIQHQMQKLQNSNFEDYAEVQNSTLGFQADPNELQLQQLSSDEQSYLMDPNQIKMRQRPNTAMEAQSMKRHPTQTVLRRPPKAPNAQISNLCQQTNMNAYYKKCHNNKCVQGTGSNHTHMFSNDNYSTKEFDTEIINAPNEMGQFPRTLQRCSSQSDSGMQNMMQNKSATHQKEKAALTTLNSARSNSSLVHQEKLEKYNKIFLNTKKQMRNANERPPIATQRTAYSTGKKTPEYQQKSSRIFEKLSQQGSLKRIENRKQNTKYEISISKLSARMRQSERNPYSDSDDEENTQNVSNLQEYGKKFKR